MAKYKFIRQDDGTDGKQVIGTGTDGKVYKVQETTTEGKVWACKVVKKKKNPKKDDK